MSFAYKQWRQQIMRQGGLFLPGKWSEQLTTLDKALDAYSKKKTTQNEQLVKKALVAWKFGIHSRQEGERVVKARKLLPDSVQQILATVDTDEIVVYKSLKEKMRDLSTGDEDEFSWDIYFRVVPTVDYGTLVKVPIYAVDGRGEKMPDKWHYGWELTDKIRHNWSSTIGRIWQGAEFTYEPMGVVSDKSRIKFEIEWVDKKRALASKPLRSNKVCCIKRKPGARGHDAALDGTVNSGYWGADDGKVSGPNERCAIAHEFGHLIGNPDEYNRVWFKGRVTQNNGGVMDSHELQKPKAGHFYLIGSALAKHFGYKENQCYITYHKTKYTVGNNHPWL